MLQEDIKDIMNWIYSYKHDILSEDFYSGNVDWLFNEDNSEFCG